jgi:hypothetical protein
MCGGEGCNFKHNDLNFLTSQEGYASHMGHRKDLTEGAGAGLWGRVHTDQPCGWPQVGRSEEHQLHRHAHTILPLHQVSGQVPPP